MEVKYKLSYSAEEIDKKLEMVDTLSESKANKEDIPTEEINKLISDVGNLEKNMLNKSDTTHTHSELTSMNDTVKNIQDKLDGKVNATSPKISTSIELHGTTPYIDFHYNNDQGDYTSRIIENASGKLSVNGVVMSNKSINIPDQNDDYSKVYVKNTDLIMETKGKIVLSNPFGNLWWRDYAQENYDTIFSPESDSYAMCGSVSHRWYKVYCASSSLSTSDEREKSEITPISDYPVMYTTDVEGNVFEQLFDKLIPTTYTLNVEKTNDLHIGFIAQDIEKSANELGLPVEDLGFISHEYWTDEKTGEEKDRYSLGYEEFIALNTHMIQKQKAQLKEQQTKIESLEERIAKLESLVNIN